MNNYNSEWRIWAKIVAVIDLIYVMLIAFLLILFVGAGSVLISEYLKNVPTEVQFGAWALLLIVTIVVLVTGVNLWATVHLIKATELDREARDAYKRCQTWQIVSFVFFVLNVVFSCMTGSYIWMTITVLLRIIFMYIVFRFMQEVQATFITTPHQMTQKI